MDIDRFWEIVEQARTVAGPAAGRARRGDGQPSAVAEALVAELSQLPLPEIVAFDRALSDVVRQADTWDVAAACWIIEHGFLSDDGFTRFCAGLVGLGRSTFEAVITDPDSLAGHHAVQEISAADGQNLWIGDEALEFAAPKAYERQTGDPEAFWDADLPAAATATEADKPRPPGNRESTDERWDLRDEGEWQRRLPKLAALLLARRLRTT